MSSCRKERKTGIRLGGPEALPKSVVGSASTWSKGGAGSSTSIAGALRSGPSATKRLGRRSELAGTAPSTTSQQPVALSRGPAGCSSESGQQQTVSRWPSIRQKKTPPLAPAASSVRVITRSVGSSLFMSKRLYNACANPSGVGNLVTAKGLRARSNIDAENAHQSHGVAVVALRGCKTPAQRPR